MSKYVVFDFDGTLVDSKAVFLSVFNQLADKYRFQRIDENNINAVRKLSMRERIRVLDVPVYKLPVLTAEFISLYKRSIDSILLINGITEVLQALENSGYRTAIVSSNAESSIRNFLLKNGIHHIAEVYTSSRIFGKDKVIGKFLKRKGLRTADMIYVGDEQRDIIACHKHGVRIVWVGWGFETKEAVEESRPHFMAFTPAELLQIVKENL
jgi:phosphoglycolate phosphatase